MNSNKYDPWPTVAIITINYNGKKHLQSCFESLQQLNYPKDKIEIICVDNNSGDGSVEFIKAKFPEICCLEAGANLGFAKGCNLGGQKAQSDYLAFLNNDAIVHENWLQELVKAVQQDEKTVCAAARILDWQGKKIDFVEGHLNFHGFARQVAWRTEVEPGFFDKRKPLLFACGGAMLIDRQVFFEVGGFDEDYFMFFEDVDLGWRLWILGYQVVYAPEAITYHRHHGSASGVNKYRRHFLYERNALATIIKNYEQTNLDRILSVALFLAAHRTTDFLQGANIAPDILHPHNWSNLPDHKLKQSISVGKFAPLLATRDIVANLPNWWQKRQMIQAQRKRSDQEIVKLFGHPLRIYPMLPELSAAYTSAQVNLMELFHIREIFEGVGKQILIITSSGLPMFNFAPTPAGLRAEALGKGLEAKGHQVLYSMPLDLIEAQPFSKWYEKLGWHEDKMDVIIGYTGPDVVIVCDWRILELIKLEVHHPIVLDCQASVTRSANGNRQTTPKEEFLANVDLFICAAQEQQEPLRLWLNQVGLAVNPEHIRPVPATTRPDGSIEGVEPLHAFCQKPWLKENKFQGQPTPLTNLPLKAWQTFRREGPERLMEEIYKYLNWRKERQKLL